MEEYLKLIEEIKSCKRCGLYKSATNKVPGEGDWKSGIMLVGEAPGREEDKQGKPFVGQAGKLLTKVLEEVAGIKGESVYITNVLKCRPPNNRDPEEGEINACKIWLERQLELIKPRVVVTLGRFAARFIFSYFNLSFTSLMRVRGNVFTARKWDREIIILPTLHPAAVLYHAAWKEMFVEDFKKLGEIVRGRKESKPLSLEDFV